MAILTAQMLVGHGRADRGGIEPTHYLFLAENGRRAWILAPENISGGEAKFKKIIWLPTEEDLLEDGLLMIAIHVLNDQEVMAAAGRCFRNPDLTALQLLKQVPPAARQQLYSLCQGVKFHTKIVLTIFEGSGLIPQLPRLAKYSVDVDVCRPKYSQYFTHAAAGLVIRGSLEEID
ncbi:MAG: hypothetical protein AB1641_18235 [Thermodesulfobacteriota bacterium]